MPIDTIQWKSFDSFDIIKEICPVLLCLDIFITFYQNGRFSTQICRVPGQIIWLHSNPFLENYGLNFACLH